MTPQSARNADALVLLLAGGRGERLHPLTRDRTKGAVPFGGQFRLVDFTLSNCVNSGLGRVCVLPQYKSASLERHLRLGWDFLRPERGEGVEVLSPQQRTGDSWYRGTADAVYQNIYTLRQFGLPQTLVLSSDHLYRMDFRPMLEAHRRRGAGLSVACIEVGLDEARRFGIACVDGESRMVEFSEKPADPRPTPHDPTRALASMGIYLFDTPLLIQLLEEAAGRPGYGHDFGGDILPRAIVEGLGVYAYDVQRETGEQDFYWRDIGVLDAYWEASMELLQPRPPFDLFGRDWPFYSVRPSPSPAAVLHAGAAPEVEDALLCPGARVLGGRVRRSLLSPGVEIGPGARVSESVLMDGVKVGAGACVRRAIVDKGVEIPPGFRLDSSASHLARTPGGVVVVGKGEALEAPRRAWATPAALEEARRVLRRREEEALAIP